MGYRIRSLLIIIIFIISGFCASAQSVTDTIINDILQVLSTRQVSALTNYIEAENHHNFIHWQILREVAGTNQEGVLKVEITRKPDSIGNVDNFTINLLADKNNIFFYRLSKADFKREGTDHFTSYQVTVNTYKDLSAFRQFESLFANTYHSPLDTTDLFQASIVYGSSCGITGTPTEYEKKLIAILRQKDVATLSAWLRSPNVEKQLYAIKGLYKLHANGSYQITAQEKDIIDAIANKKGEAQTCSGCIYSSRPINALVKEIGLPNFGNQKHLMYVASALIIGVVLLIYFLKRQRTPSALRNKA